MCIECGTQWADAAPAPCSMVTSRRWITARIICASCVNCKMRPAVLPGLFRLLSNRPNPTGSLPTKRASAFEQLRNLAVSRIYLDNIDHLTAYWVSLGLPLAQVSLSYGVDDLHGTILEEKIFHMAGATTPQQQSVAALEHAIREAGREPVQRDSYYRHISPRQTTETRATPAPAELACA